MTTPLLNYANSERTGAGWWTFLHAFAHSADTLNKLEALRINIEFTAQAFTCKRCREHFVTELGDKLSACVDRDKKLLSVGVKPTHCKQLLIDLHYSANQHKYRRYVEQGRYIASPTKPTIQEVSAVLDGIEAAPCNGECEGDAPRVSNGHHTIFMPMN